MEDINNMQNVFITYDEYNSLKNYNLAKEIKDFKMDDFDQAVMFFDEYKKYIEPERFEIEEIRPSYVLLPRFLFLENIDILEDFVYVDNQGNKKYLNDYLKEEYKLHEEYQLTGESIKSIDSAVKELDKGGSDA